MAGRTAPGRRRARSGTDSSASSDAGAAGDVASTTDATDERRWSRDGSDTGEDSTGVDDDRSERPGDRTEETTAPSVVERTVYRDGGRDGAVDLAIGYEIPDAVSKLAFWIERPSVAVVATDGFERTNVDDYTWQGSVDGPAFEWDGTGDRAAVRLRQPLADGEPATYGAGGEDWSLLLRPRTHTRWRYRGPEPRIDRRAAVQGAGIAGEQFALLGPYETVERTVTADAGATIEPAEGCRAGRPGGTAGAGVGRKGAGQDGDRRVDDRQDRDRPVGAGRVGSAFPGSETVRLVVPEAADLATAPERILDSLAAVSERLDVGGRTPVVSVFVAPTDGVTWAHRGLSLGPDARVNDAAPLATPTNIWVHEYVHTRQDRGATTSGTEWLLEATAEYYAVTQAFERGPVDFPAYRHVLERGIDGDAADAVLADPGTWTDDAQYRKGALVVATLDRRIRAATDGETTFQAVLRAWNEQAPDPFDAEAFADAVEAAGGPAARAAAISYTQTSSTPASWSASAHAATFDVTPADCDVESVAADDPLTGRQPGERTGEVAIDPAAARHR